MRPRRLLAIWLVTAFLGCSLAVAMIGYRIDLMGRLVDWTFVTAFSIFVAGFLGSSWLTCRYLVPGQEMRRPRALGLGLASLIFIGLTIYAGLGGETPHDSTSLTNDLACCLRMAVGALIPNGILLGLVSKFAPFHARRVVLYIMITSTFVVTGVAQLNCPFDSLRHVMIGHGLLLLIVNVATYGLYLVLFRTLCRNRTTAVSE